MLAINYFGPFLVRPSNHSRSNTAKLKIKRYGVRIIHNATEGGRGHVKQIMSNNGTNLTGGKHELQDFLSLYNQVVNSLFKRSTKLKFNSFSSQWIGWSWEELAKSIQCAL